MSSLPASAASTDRRARGPRRQAAHGDAGRRAARGVVVSMSVVMVVPVIMAVTAVALQRHHCRRADDGERRCRVGHLGVLGHLVGGQHRDTDAGQHLVSAHCGLEWPDKEIVRGNRASARRPLQVKAGAQCRQHRGIVRRRVGVGHVAAYRGPGYAPPGRRCRPPPRPGCRSWPAPLPRTRPPDAW